MLNYLKWLSVQIWFEIYLMVMGGYLMIKELVWDRHNKLPSYPEQEGITVVITGGGRGIGLCAVEKLVGLGVKVVMGCRDREGVVTKLEKMNISNMVEVLTLDLMSLTSVRAFASQVVDLGRPVHILINNAGIMFGPRRETKEGGFESQLATNYLGHFLLSHLLLPVLEKSGTSERPARIVNVSSIAHYVGSWLDLSDINLRQIYSPKQAYGNSKVAQVMFTKYLSQSLKSENVPVSVFALHPGVVYSDLYQNSPFLKGLFGLLMKSTEQGADTLVHATIDPDLSNKSGLYLENSRPARSSNYSKDLVAQRQLWVKTCKMLNIDNFGNEKILER